MVHTHAFLLDIYLGVDLLGVPYILLVFIVSFLTRI